MRLHLRAGIVLGLLATACGKDPVAPKSLADPQATTTQMAAFDTLFNVSALNSLNALGVHMQSEPLTTVGALATAANPLASSSALRPFSKGLETSRMLQQLVPTLIDASAQDLFPAEVDGTTFEWDTTGNQYVASSRAGAPADGVRFILYAVDLIGMPVEPLVEVGYVEFDDESTASLDKVHVRVAEPDGSPVYVDYTVSLASQSSSSARLEAAGYVTNGSADTLDFSGTITVSGDLSSATVTQDVSFDVDSRDVHVRLLERITLEGDTFHVRIFFSFTHGIETVTVDANFDLGVGETVNGTVTIKVDGGPFAFCTIDAAPGSYSLTCEGADADGLTAQESEAIDAIGAALGRIETMFQGILLPATSVIGGAS